MPRSRAPEVPLNETEREELRILVRAHGTSQQIAFRARIILLLAESTTILEVASSLETTPATVRLWRRHWLERTEATVIERLRDAPRPGKPQTFTADQWQQIIALAYEPPALCGRPISHWTPRDLADEAIKRGIVSSISVRHVWRIFKSGRVDAASKSPLAQQRSRPEGR